MDVGRPAYLPRDARGCILRGTLVGVFGVRDIVWSLVLCGVLTLAFDCRPRWQAQAFVEAQAEAAFLEAYAGRRWAGTDALILPEDGGGAHDDRFAQRVQQRRLEIKAARVSWSGRRAELVVRHVIRLEDGTAGGEDASQDIHLRLEKRAGEYRYTHFELHGVGALETQSNPFLEALRRAQGAGGSES